MRFFIKKFIYKKVQNDLSEFIQLRVKPNHCSKLRIKNKGVNLKKNLNRHSFIHENLNSDFYSK